MENQSIFDHARAIRDYCKSTECNKCVFRYDDECQIQRAPCGWWLVMSMEEVVQRLESIKEDRPKNLDTQALELVIKMLKIDIKNETT